MKLYELFENKYERWEKYVDQMDAKHNPEASVYKNEEEKHYKSDATAIVKKPAPQPEKTKFSNKPQPDDIPTPGYRGRKTVIKRIHKKQ